MPSRALRIGVFLRGQLVEERVFADATPITIGQSLRCRLSIPAEGLPAAHVLFARDRRQLVLRALPGMTGRIEQGAASVELRDGARGCGDLPIERDARGRLCAGEVTILFQEAAVRAPAPRPQLPASVRRSLAERGILGEPRLAVIVGASLCVHLAIGAWAWLTDVEVPSMFSPRIAAEYRHPRHDTVAVTLPDPAAPAPGEAAPGAASPVAPRQIPRPIVPRPAAPGESDPGLSEDDARSYAQLLTGAEAARGTPGDLAPRQPHGDLRQQIEDQRARGVEVGREPRARDADGAARLGTAPSGPRLEGPAEIARQTADREQRRARIDLVAERPPGPRPPPEHDLTAEAVAEKIRTVYMSGLQRCYQKGLALEPQLAGKIKLAFTVGARGQVLEPAAGGLSPEVDACVAGIMAGWRFGIPRDRDRAPTEAAFTLSLVLRAR